MDVGADAAAKKGRRGMEGKKDYEERENGSRRGGIREWKGIIIALIAGMTAVACVVILTTSLVSYKKTSGGGGLTGRALRAGQQRLPFTAGKPCGQEGGA